MVQTNPPAPILGDANLRGVTVQIRLSFDERVIGMVVDKVSDWTTFAPEQRRPVPGLSSATGCECLLPIGLLQDRMLILMDIRKRMPSAAVGPVSSWLH